MTCGGVSFDAEQGRALPGNGLCHQFDDVWFVVEMSSVGCEALRKIVPQVSMWISGFPQVHVLDAGRFERGAKGCLREASPAR